MSQRKNKQQDLAERVERLEGIIGRLLTHHGETYPGALEDLEALAAPQLEQLDEQIGELGELIPDGAADTTGEHGSAGH